MKLSSVWPAGGRWGRNAFLPVLALALLLRVAWALAVPVMPVSDSHVYDLLARNLASGLGFCWAAGNPTAQWPVGTSFVYSIFYRVFGLSYTPIVVFNICLSLATIWLTMLLAERWFNRKVAIIAGYLSACWPVQIQFTSVLASELIFNFLMVALLLVWDSPKLNPWLKAVLIGILAAAALYVRPVALFLPAILGAITIATRKKVVRPIAITAVAYILMALAIAPWSLRNTRVFGRFVLMSSNGGGDLWLGNNPFTQGQSSEFPADTLNMRDVDRDVYLGQIAAAYIRQYPGHFVMHSLKKLYWLYDHETIGVHWNLAALESIYGARAVWVLKLISDLFWWVTLLLGLAGTCFLIVQRGPREIVHSPLIAVWLYFSVIYSVILATDRYHFGCLPSIAILAAFALYSAGQRIVEVKSNCPEAAQSQHSRAQP